MNWKIIIVAALIGIVATGIYSTGYSHGEERKQVEWDKDAKRLAAAQKIADAQQQDKFDRLAEDHRKHNIEVSNEHQIAEDKLRSDLALSRAAVRAAGGLRIPTSVCPGPAKGGAEAGSDGRHDADVAGTVALPPEIDEDLQDSADEADRVTEIARACQSWVRKHGFYSAASAVP